MSLKKGKHFTLGRVLIKLALDFLQLLPVRLLDESSKPPQKKSWRTFFLYVGRIARTPKNIKSKIYGKFSLSRRGVQFNVTKKAYQGLTIDDSWSIRGRKFAGKIERESYRDNWKGAAPLWRRFASQWNKSRTDRARSC